MVGPAPPSQLTAQQTTTSAAAATTSASAEEEALKRNTDCVYFLASPLTCKKGSECEYRHSDVARLNPRDCWFWLNGNCLNPKCGFRHPPLDGLLGSQVSTPLASSLPPSHVATMHATNAPYGSGSGSGSGSSSSAVSSKPGVPCIFFQKGFCLKGDRCPFLHAPNSVNNKALQPPGPIPATEPLSFKKPFGGLENCKQEKKFPQPIVPKCVELPSQTKPVVRIEPSSRKDEFAIEKNVIPASGFDDEMRKYREISLPIAANGNSVSRSNRMQQPPRLDDDSSINEKDTEEISREPSPGFDVLVDDELRDSDYYHNEDQFGRTRGHEGRNDYEIGRSVDYNSIGDVDRGMYGDPHGYESYDRMQGQYPWEQRRASSERMSGGSVHLERRRYGRADSPDQVDESDLRYRLSKHKRVNGLRSVISHDYSDDRHADDRGYQSLRREMHHIPPHETSLSSRLRGRIKIPGRSSSPSDDMHPEKEMDRGRNHGRLSPGRQQMSSHQVRLRDRIKGRVQEDPQNGGRNNRAPRLKRDIINDDNTNFAGPKSLAELKGSKGADSNEQHVNDQQSLGKRKYQKLEGHGQTVGDLSFAGPMPLEEILKRKKRGETPVTESRLTSDDNEDNNSKGSKARSITSFTANTQGSLSENEADFRQAKEAAGSASSDNPGAEETKFASSQSTLHDIRSELETEDGMIVEEDQEHEGYDQRDGDYDYEQVDGENYHLDEGENVDAEEYLDDDDDDDDGDDFAKKMGVIYS